MIVLYHKDKTLSDQDWCIQVDALNTVGCTTVFTEKKSGTTLKKRTAFEECMTYLRKGDTLVVTRVERQLEGVARAKKEGKYKGRKPTAQAKSQEVIQLIRIATGITSYYGANLIISFLRSDP